MFSQRYHDDIYNNVIMPLIYCNVIMVSGCIVIILFFLKTSYKFVDNVNGSSNMLLKLETIMKMKFWSDPEPWPSELWPRPWFYQNYAAPCGSSSTLGLCVCILKGTVSRDFWPLVFFTNQPHRFAYGFVFTEKIDIIRVSAVSLTPLKL
jgi:hypothetical protein